MPDVAPLTPMMSQYRRVKDRHQDAIVFFRLGDFYETFFDDAVTAARELEITLTSREAGKGRRVPMAGIPHHAADGYIARLLDRGYRVAICDQVEDPAMAKGLVQREVTRVITPGTVVDPRALPERAPNYLAVVVAGTSGGAIGLAVCDFSTGEFMATEFIGESPEAELLDELGRLSPRELLLDPALLQDAALAARLQAESIVKPRQLEQHDPEPKRAAASLAADLGTVSLTAFGLADRPAAVVAAWALLSFLRRNQGGFSHLQAPCYYSRGDFMCLDSAARRHLELVANARDGKRQGSLLWSIDATVTPAGSRLLRAWLVQPLTALAPLVRRQEAVAQLAADGFVRAELRQVLRRVHDIERLVGRAGTELAGPRDLVALAEALRAAETARAILCRQGADGLLSELAAAIDPHHGLAMAIEQTLVDVPPAAATDGGLVRPGINAEVDRLRELRSGAKDWLAEFEARERERTGIRSLKIGFNRVFGYYLEVTKANLAAAPAEYTRRQTLANAERFVTPELKERESEILGAEERLYALEHEIFCGLRSEVAAAASSLQGTARAVAAVDCLAALAEIAVARGYCRPVLSEGAALTIVAGRHPVLEMTVQGGFVPNDISFGAERPRLLVITGPNMAGKSTYLRQAALIVLLAQIGSFVPAERAAIGLADRVFTRIGAHDDLAAGQSTFMVEMQEVAHILRLATQRSLVILDEVGRGTSTFDGISLARAVLESLADLRARTLFATHYHELIAMADTWEHIANFSTSVIDQGGEIVFTHKVRPGGSNRSYGIEVAKLAGLPATVLDRATVLLHEIEDERARLAEAAASDGGAGGLDDTVPGRRTRPSRTVAPQQLSFVATPVRAHSRLRERLRSLDIQQLTPLAALNLLAELQDEAQREEG